MTIKLSHSAKDTFLQCPKKYDLHYNQKIRPTYEGSALFFGNAVDEALNVLLLAKKKRLTKEETELAQKDVYEVFDEYFKEKKIAREMVDLRTDLRANYYKSDFDSDLLALEDEKTLAEYMKVHGYEEACPEKLRNALFSSVEESGYQGLDLIDRSFLNYCTWLSMRRKGHMMIEAYERDLMPKIQEVLSIQRYVYIEGDGVTVRGLIDFEAILDDGKKYTIDNKTSSRPYKADSVETSPQLATYNYVTQYQNAAYFVMIKKPQKIKVKTCQKCGTVTEGREKTCKVGGKDRCGGEFDVAIRTQIRTQGVRGTISEELEDQTLREFEEVTDMIEAGDFPENREGDCFHFGQKCPYYRLCRDGKMDGLKDCK